MISPPAPQSFGSLPVLVSFPADPTRSVALVAYWPSIGCWSWSGLSWRPFDATCVLPVQADPASPCGDIVAVRLPDQVARAGADVAILLVVLGALGQAVGTLDVQVIGP